MATYFVVNTPSNLIVQVISTSYTPPDPATRKFVLANEKSLSLYYKHLKKNPDVLMDIGELMAKSPHISEQVAGSSKSVTQAKIQRFRNPVLPVKQVPREQQIADWIRANPQATSFDLDYEFCTGITVARAYIEKYRFN